MWGSFFSRKFGSAMQNFPRRFWSEVEVAVATPVPAELVTAAELERRVLELRGDWK
jgi:hypothetical protein